MVGVVGPVAKFSGRQFGLELGDQRVVHSFLHIDALDRRAQLPAVRGFGAHDVGGGFFQISVGSHDGRRFAAQLQ